MNFYALGKPYHRNETFDYLLDITYIKNGKKLKHTVEISSAEMLGLKGFRNNHNGVNDLYRILDGAINKKAQQFIKSLV